MKSSELDLSRPGQAWRCQDFRAGMTSRSRPKAASPSSAGRGKHGAVHEVARYYVGGTFTDVVLYDEENSRLIIDQVPSMPADPSQGVLAAIARPDFGLAISPMARPLEPTQSSRERARAAVLENRRIPRDARGRARQAHESSTRQPDRRRRCRAHACSRSTRAVIITARSSGG